MRAIKNTTQAHRRPWRTTLSVLLAGSVASGCSLTPSPLTHDERAAVIAQDQAVLFEKQESLDAPLTVYQAMARALKYNLDHRVKMMERAFGA